MLVQISTHGDRSELKASARIYIGARAALMLVMYNVHCTLYSVQCTGLYIGARSALVSATVVQVSSLCTKSVHVFILVSRSAPVLEQVFTLRTGQLYC